MTTPGPGISGDYKGSCVVCLKGTDTGLAFVGEAEWALAGLQVLGVPPEQADGVLAAATKLDTGQVPSTEITITVTVCEACAAAASAPLAVGVLALGVPHYRPRAG